MKYVAFLDVLGFKNKLRSISQQEAIDFIASFSQTIYTVFQQNQKQNVKGYIVSDSVILYTDSDTDSCLHEIVDIVIDICKSEFSENGILLRGAIAKGAFDSLPTRELSNLQKRLIVGQAYVDAYLLEDTTKTIGINLTDNVYYDIKKAIGSYDIIEEKLKDKSRYILRFITIDYLLDSNNAQQFVNLAREAKWLPHYYNTLHCALLHENKEKKADMLFEEIMKLVCDNKPNSNWRDLDLFIKNGFDDNVFEAYKTRFLKYIRQHLFFDQKPTASDEYDI